MKNDLFSIGPFTVHGYGLMMTIAILTAYFMVEYRGKKRGLDEDEIFNFGIWAVVGGLLGSKVLYLITRLPDLIAQPSMLLDSIKDGWVVYGSIIGGILGAWIYCRRKGWPFLRMFDLVAPSLALAQGIGRIGCLLAGCCYGIMVDPSNPIAIVFHDSVYAPNEVPLLPTQVISSALDFLHFGVLMFLSKRLKKDGQVAGCYLIFYSIGRFVLEYFRGDLIRGKVGVLSTSQFIAIFMCLAGVVLLSARRPRPQSNPEISEQKPDAEQD